MPPRLPPALLLLVLAACGTPQQQCINAVTRDLRVVEELIGEAQVNLARGYGMEDVTVFVPRWDYCAPAVIVQNADGSQTMAQAPQMCMDNEATTVTRPVAIDLAAERRKLAQLQAQQGILMKRAEPAIAQCRVQYPE